MYRILILALLFMVSMGSYAAQTVNIVWPFSPASNQANALRVLIDNANSIQSKYIFVFDNRPGAGGSIAVNHVINSQQPTLLMMSTSVFVRPKFYPEQSYDINKLQPVVITANNSPLAILSKDPTLDILSKKSVLKVGMVQGSITESVAKALQESLKNEVILVPYQASINATNDLMGGHIDASVEFIKDSIPWVEANKAYIVGVTGSHKIDKFVTLESAGVKNTSNLISNYYVLAGPSAGKDFISDMYGILSQAMVEQNIVSIWKQDYATVEKRSYQDTVKFWSTQKSYWNIK